MDTRYVAFAADPLLYHPIALGSPSVFRNYVGTLDGQGRAQALLAIPAIPSLAGLRLYTVAAAIDPGALSFTAWLSNVVEARVTK